jgi:DNA-binding beta-propeller fold protein YncE
MGAGGLDYLYADSEERRLYVPRGNEVLVFDLDTLKSVGTVPNARARDVTVDPKSHHGFCTSNPVVMWDSKTLKTIKTIPVQGRPDLIYCDPETAQVFVLSHAAPNATVLAGADGSVVGTIDLGGAPEQAVSDGNGHLYVDLEDKNQIAVVDLKTLKVTAHYDLGEMASAPTALALDVKNHILFAMCSESATCVIVNAEDGKVLATLPIGKDSDSGRFNPATMEAFSSQGDGTLTIIKEKDPTSFEVEQTVQTKPRAKTCALDTKTGNIILITTEPAAAPSPSAAPSLSGSAGAAASATPEQSRGERRGGGPSLLDILVVGRE